MVQCAFKITVLSRWIYSYKFGRMYEDTAQFNFGISAVAMSSYSMSIFCATLCFICIKVAVRKFDRAGDLAHAEEYIFRNVSCAASATTAQRS